MRCVVVDAYGGPDTMRIVDAAEPRPGRGEVRVRLLAAGVSYTDMLIRAGSYLECPKPPFTPGYELVGVVDEVGEGCETVRPGERVAAITVHGAYAESICIPERNAVVVPTDVDPVEIAALVLTYVTAEQLLFRYGRARPGESVLVHGAAGQVGVAVLELGVPAGLRVFGTVSAAGRERVERLGGVAIDYTKEDFLACVRDTAGGGVDLALDGMGGGISLRSFRALRPGGRLLVYGHHATLADGRKNRRAWLVWYATTACVWTWGALSPRRSVHGYRIAKLRDRYPDAYAADLRRVVTLLRDRKIHPTIAERMPLTEARRAHELLQRARVNGKVVLVPP